MGRSVYLFELSKYDCNKLQLAKKLLSLDYNVIKDENEWGVYLEKILEYGIIEVHINEKRSFFRVAKPNSEKTIDVILRDVNNLKKDFPNLIFYDCETKTKVDLDNNSVKSNFLKSKNEFLQYFSNVVNNAPVRENDVFK
jgi:hypothetical protein